MAQQRDQMGFMVDANRTRSRFSGGAEEGRGERMRKEGKIRVAVHAAGLSAAHSACRLFRKSELSFVRAVKNLALVRRALTEIRLVRGADSMAVPNDGRILVGEEDRHSIFQRPYGPPSANPIDHSYLGSGLRLDAVH